MLIKIKHRDMKRNLPTFEPWEPYTSHQCMKNPHSLHKTELPYKLNPLISPHLIQNRRERNIHHPPSPRHTHTTSEEAHLPFRKASQVIFFLFPLPETLGVQSLIRTSPSTPQYILIPELFGSGKEKSWISRNTTSAHPRREDSWDPSFFVSLLPPLAPQP